MLIDIRMKDMDGITLLKEIKKLDKDAEAVMVSAVEDLNVIEEAKRYGARGYLTKPLVLDELEKVVMEQARWIKTGKKT